MDMKNVGYEVGFYGYVVCEGSKITLSAALTQRLEGTRFTE